MSDDLISLRMLLVSEAEAERQVLRRVASQAPVLIELHEIDGGADGVPACDLLGRDKVDLVFLDSRMPRPGRKAVIEAARISPGRPLVILVGSAEIKTREVLTDGLDVDGVLAKPIDVEEAKTLVGRCVRARLSSRALIVDDSATVRSVVRKVLQASRFVFECDEAEEGSAAIEQIARQHYEIMFLDCNMPGLDGFGTLAELKRKNSDIKVVMMTGAGDHRIVDKVRAAGASDFLYKPFYAKDIDAVLNRLFGLMPPKPY